MSAAFEFTPENQQRFEQIISQYPRKRAAMLPTLHLAQEQNGHISPEVEAYVADLLEVPVVDVHEVLTFYTLFSDKPRGRHHVRVCGSLSCWIRGSDDVSKALREKLGIEDGDITEDGRISWETVPDCLGACEMAPMIQVDGHFEGNLTEEKIEKIVDELKD
ncbi:MAG: NAD(P)H-dependent oxidoreductase subunit E [Acidobacteriota bacterium]|jgi:NADH-quinone oxidoreductase E subunit